MKHTLLLLLPLTFLLACSPHSEVDTILWQGRSYAVEIFRDDFGVPHIYGQTDADAVFGLMFAQCEDDFPRVERNFAWAIGRLAEAEGTSQLYSDVRAQMFMTEEEARAYYSSLPDWLKKLCVAWADGINFYLEAHPDVSPQVIQSFEPWMTMYFTEGSIGGDIERVKTKKIRAFYENSEGPSVAEIPAYEQEPKGSNGFAISGSLTQSGNAMLWINPHTSFYFRGEYHMVSEEGLNAYGAVTWGQFFIYQGFNETTGWMHTSTYTDVIDEYEETIIEKDGGLYYVYGDEEREVWQKTITLKYRDADKLTDTTFTIYRTHHGPITHLSDGKWAATSLMWEPAKALEQSYIRTKNDTYAEFREMMALKTNSSNNTVFADADGNIAYFHGNFIPVRDTAFDFSMPVDGSNPQTDWLGLHPVDEAITVLNPTVGWIQNCNSTPFTSAGADSPKEADYPYYMSTAPENFRGVHAISLLEKLQKEKNLTLDGLIELGYDPYLPAFEQVIPSLIEAFDGQAGYLDMKEAIEVLRSWDKTTGKASVGMSLAHVYGMSLYRNVDVPGHLRGMERFNYFSTIGAAKQLEVFQKAIDEIEAKFGTWQTPWGEICRFQRITGRIGAPFDDEAPSKAVGLTTGRWGALAAYGMRTKQQTKKIYGTRGNSFVAAVEFGDRVKAKTILAGGQSSDPDSPHFDDQVDPYINAQFKEVAFYREEVEARAQERYVPGQRRE